MTPDTARQRAEEFVRRNRLGRKAAVFSYSELRIEDIAALLSELATARRLQDEAWESRNAIATENQDLIERLTQAEAALAAARDEVRHLAKVEADLRESLAEAETWVDVNARLRADLATARQALQDAEEILRKAQAPRRKDGTYNYSREAFEQMANDYFAVVVPVEKQP